MNLFEYQKQCSTTAFPYRKAAELATDPSQAENTAQLLKLFYTVMGLIGEVGELQEVHRMSEDEFVGEIGDVMWYVAMLTDELGLDLYKISVLETIDDVSNLIEAVGAIANKAKKLLRDDKHIDENFRNFCSLRISRILDVLKIECSDRRVDFNHILEYNINKLQSRKERGALGGEGNSR